MPTQTDGHFCLGISSTPHRMAWNIICPFTMEYTFCVVYLAPNFVQRIRSLTIRHLEQFFNACTKTTEFLPV